MDFAEIRRKLNFQLRQRIDEPEMDAIPDVLYHYTTQEGVSGILTSSVFWMTDVQFLDDYTEINHGTSIISQVVQKEMREMDKDTALFWGNLLEAIQEILNRSNFYICSFCTNPDVLGNWERYGDKLSGYNIGLSKKYFQRMFRENKHPITVGLIRYSKEEFTGHEELEKQIKSYINITNSFLSKFHGKIKKESHIEKLLTNVGAILTSRLVGEICCVKHDGFEDQREFRMLISHSKKNENLQIHTSPNGKKYIHSPQFNNDELASIHAGPKVTPSEKIAKLLPAFNLTLDRSKIPIR